MKPNYLFQPRPNGTFYARVRVPTDLVPYARKQIIVRSLKTKDLQVAKRRLHETVGEIFKEFEKFNSRDYVTSLILDIKHSTKDDETDERAWEIAQSLAERLDKLTAQRLMGEVEGRASLHTLAEQQIKRWIAEKKYTEKFDQKNAERRLKEAVREFSLHSGMVFIDTIRTKHLASWVDHMTTEGKLSAKTANNKLSQISLLFKSGIRSGIVERNYAEGAGAKGKAGSGAEAHTDEELKQLFNDPKLFSDTRDCVTVALLLGLRISEVFKIKPKDAGSVYVEGTKNVASSAYLPVIPEVNTLLKRIPFENKGLFRRVSRNFNGLSGELGFDSKTTHGLRKRYAQELEAIGCEPLNIVRLMRHTTGKITFDTYSKAEMDTLRPWNEKVAKKFLKVINGNKKI
jgi:integrase